jgi:hypothetical protein
VAIQAGDVYAIGIAGTPLVKIGRAHRPGRNGNARSDDAAGRPGSASLPGLPKPGHAWPGAQQARDLLRDAGPEWRPLV